MQIEVTVMGLIQLWCNSAISNNFKKQSQQVFLAYISKANGLAFLKAVFPRCRLIAHYLFIDVQWQFGVYID